MFLSAGRAARSPRWIHQGPDHRRCGQVSLDAPPFQQRGSIFVGGVNVEDRERRGVAVFFPRHPSDGAEPSIRFSGQEGNNGRLCEGFYHSVNPTFASVPRLINGSYQLIVSVSYWKDIGKHIRPSLIHLYLPRSCEI